MPPYSSNLRDVIERDYNPTPTYPLGGGAPTTITTTAAMLPTFVPIPFTTGSYLDGCVQRACGGHTSGVPPGCIVQLCGASGCGKTTVALAAAVHVIADAILLSTTKNTTTHHVIWVSSTLTIQPFPTSLLIAAVRERLEELGHPDTESIEASHLEPFMTVIVGVQTPGHLVGVLQELNDQASTSTTALGKAIRVLVVLDCGAVVLQAASSELIPQRAVGDGDELINPSSGAAPLRKTVYPFVLSELKRSIRNLLNTFLHTPNGGGGSAVIMTNMCTSSGSAYSNKTTTTPVAVPFGGPVWRSVPDINVLMTMTDEDPFLDTVNIEQTFTIVP